jgi:hypothetical protein
MYKVAYKYNDDVVFYFDSAGNKYVATGGSLAWRINNPGLVHNRTLFSRKLKAIGSFGPYAIFSHPQEGRKALAAWIQSKKYFNSSLKALAEHYQPKSPAAFASQLSSLSKIPPETKIKLLNQQELSRLLISIEKLCGYTPAGNETFSLLPKIIAKIENSKGKEDTYLIGNNIVLSKKEAIEWIQSHRLDGVIVHEHSGAVHLRSRPNHYIQNLKVSQTELRPSQGKIDTLIRTVGVAKTGQCIWGFINGIKNSKDEALESAEKISQAARGERVYYMPNDTVLYGVKDAIVCLALKLTANTPIVQWAAKFFRYLLSESKKDKTHPPVIIMAHSQGAIITERALEMLSKKERKQLIIFTFGGGSFITAGKSHPDSHNYASAADFVCRLGSPNIQHLALKRYFGSKDGRSEQEVIYQLALHDAMLDVDSTDPKTIEIYTKQRMKHYAKEFSKISNVTILDPDPKWKHRFSNSCYQAAVQMITKKYGCQ